MLRKIAAIVVLLAHVALPKTNVQAANAVVGNGDSSSCTEAAFDTALAAVQSDGLGGILSFNCGGTAAINFSSLKTITSSVLILGNDQITLSGQNATSLFAVNAGALLVLNNLILTKACNAGGDGGAIKNSGDLEINGVTIQDSMVNSLYSEGAIYNGLTGVLTISNSVLQNNSAGNGGALFLRNLYTPTVISNSIISSNSAVNLTNGWGGAILVWDGASVTLHNTRLEGNHAQHGGGIYGYARSTTTIDQKSVISGNLAFDLVNQGNYSYGGGIRNYGMLYVDDSTLTLNSAGLGGGIDNLGTLTLSNSTLSQNTGNREGGGVRNTGTTLITSSTISSNNSLDGAGVFTLGAGGMTMQNSTLSSNSGITFWNGGGTSSMTNVTIFATETFHPAVVIDLGTIQVKNVIFSRISGSAATNCYFYPNVSLTSQGNNLADDTSCAFTNISDKVVGDVKLASLGNDGGPTLTHLPLPGSPAKDNGTLVVGLTTDQRDKPRPAGLAPDIGAVELQPDDWKFVFLPLIRR